MVHQHPVGQAVGDQFHGTDFFHSAGIHGLQHVAGDFGLVMIMELFVYAGHRFHITGYYQQIVADNQNRYLLVEISEESVKIRLALGVDAGGGFIQ